MAKAGRKPIPDEIKKQLGTLRKHRMRGDSPNAMPPDDLPDPPEWLGDIAAQEWRTKIIELSAMKILAKADLTLLEALCNEWETYQAAEVDLRKNGRFYVLRDENDEVRHAAPKPQVKIAKDALAEYRRISSEFGFSPAARMSIKVEKDDKTPTDPAAFLFNN